MDGFDFHALLIECAKAEGFPVAGAVDLDLAFEAFTKEVQDYDHWLARGYGGAMEYLTRGRDRRADPRLVFPGARSILCVALPYPARPAGAPSGVEGPRYARYLRLGDYHDLIAEKLERVMSHVRERLEESGRPVPKWKICVDTSAVLERSWAMLAGLGWIGKNTLLIHPRLGSYLLLGEVLIDIPTGRGPAPVPNLCGHCSRCLHGCPTRAFVEPGVLDAKKCTSYLTLEKREELPREANETIASLGTWVAGCDVCQEVCPFNTKAARSDRDIGDDLEDATDLERWEELLDESAEEYRSRVSRSSLKRVKPAQFSRNLAIALANALPGFSEAKRRELEAKIRKRATEEADEIARKYWKRCLGLFPESQTE